MVNTATACGYTPQFEGLEALYRPHRADGFVVLGFPANDFAGQEPRSDKQIAAFCKANYGVSFPMFAKTTVTGDGANRLFRRLTAAAGAPEWNFNKYLVDRRGRVVARFSAGTEPDGILRTRTPLSFASAGTGPRRIAGNDGCVARRTATRRIASRRSCHARSARGHTRRRLTRGRGRPARGHASHARDIAHALMLERAFAKAIRLHLEGHRGRPLLHQRPHDDTKGNPRLRLRTRPLY